MSRLVRFLALAAAGCAGAAAAADAPQASYPKSRALADVAAWIGADTPLQLSQVVDVGPAAITAVTSAAPTGEPRGFLANIAAEAVDPAIAQQEAILSWTMPVEIDCEKRVVRLGDMTGYPTRDLRSGGRLVRSADSAWVAPAPAAPLGVVVHALCDRDYKRPFANTAKVASGKPPRPEPPPGPPPAVVNLKPPTVPRPLTEAAAKGATSPPASPTSEVGPAAGEPAPKPLKPRAIAHGTSPYIVQAGASPSADEANAILVRLQKKFATPMAGLKTEAVSAVVDGKTVYRAQISGFAGAADANALCEQLKSSGHACFVRR